MSVTERAPARVPRTLGVNVTLIVQFAPGPRAVGLMGHAPMPVLVAPKSPDAVIKVINKPAFPLFVRVTGCEALVVASN